MASGIYKIINLLNNKIYVGSAVNIDRRIYDHFSTLRRNIHHNIHLQSSYNKYGEEYFKFEVIEYCNKEILIEREQFYIDDYEACKKGYNINPNANGSQLGLKRSLKIRQAISNRLRGKKRKPFSKETKRKMALAKKGKTSPNKGKTFSEEHRKNLSISHMNKIHTEETKKKMSENMKGNTYCKGKTIPKEVKMKMSIAHKKRWEDKKINNVTIN